MFLYKDIEFSHIFPANIVKTHFVIKMLPFGGLRGTKVLAPHLRNTHGFVDLFGVCLI